MSAAVNWPHNVLHPFYRRIGIVLDEHQHDLDQDFSGREYLLDVRDTFDDLEARSRRITGLYVASVFSFMCSANPLNSNLWSYSQSVAFKEVLEHAKWNHDHGVSMKSSPASEPTHPTLIQMLRNPALRGFRSRHHDRRGLEDDEELSRRDLDTEEFLFGRENDDFLVERDAFDDLD